MAYLGTDDKQLQNQQQQSQQQQQGMGSGGGGGSASVNPLLGSESGSVNGSVKSTQAPQGGGGTGWTNIQSYLTANQGNHDASKTLAQNVGSAFDQDKNSINNQANQMTSQAQNFTQSRQLAPDQASDMIAKLSQGNQYGANQQGQSKGFDSNAYYDQFARALDTYKGPTEGSFAPGLSANTQNYGTGLQTAGGTQALMNQFYNQANNGKALNLGQSNLQDLLQTNDKGFQDTKQNLLNQYAGLNPWLQNKISDTNNSLKNAQDQFNASQKNLNNYLTQNSTQDNDQITKAMNDWNTAEQAIASGQNKVLGAGPTGMVTPTDPLGRGLNIAPIDTSKFYDTYNPGQMADMTNAPGVDNQRNQFNVIQKILNHSNQAISPQQAVSQHGSWGFNQPAYQQALDSAIPPLTVNLPGLGEVDIPAGSIGDLPPSPPVDSIDLGNIMQGLPVVPVDPQPAPAQPSPDDFSWLFG